MVVTRRAAVLICLSTFWAVIANGQDPPAQFRWPAQIDEVLNQLGVTPQSGQRLLFGDLRPPFPVRVEKNPQVASLMERARREDLVVPPTDALFSADNVSVGLWQSDFFISNYGTALLLAEPYSADRIPIVLVHGINGSPRDFDDLVGHFAGSAYQLMYFYYPTGMALTDAAHQLEARVRELLSRHPAARFGVVGHSMGGLVVKGMLDHSHDEAFMRGWYVFVSIASPWSGVEAAAYAGRVPRHPPSWDDLAPGSAFLQKIQNAPIPNDVHFYLFFGARSDKRYLSALGNNDGVLTLDSILDSPVSKAARDTFGFYEDHTSILSAPLFMRRLGEVVDGEMAR